MKKTLLSSLFFASVITLGITLSSNSSGPGGNRTGSPGSSGNCSSCHGGGNLNGSLSVRIVNTGDTIHQTVYTPGQDYEIYVKAKGNSTKMGFQATVVNAAGAAAGTLGTAPSGTNTYNSGTKVIWGHTSPSATGTWRIKWTAPVSGSNDVSVFAASVISNSSNNDNGDQPVTATNASKEATSSSVSSKELESIQILGNPVSDVVKLNQTVKQMAVWNNAGQLVAKSFQSNQCDIHTLNSGTYYLQVITNNNLNKLMVISVNH